jgi:hypothetical protein
MRMMMRSFLALFSFSLAILASNVVAAQTYTFDVFVDDRNIGTQVFNVKRSGQKTQVKTKADFEVRIALIPFFNYDHNATEVYVDGCLESIDSKTDKDGEDLFVKGRKTAAGFAVTSKKGKKTLKDTCVRAFPYWDKTLLEGRTQLLNSENGDYDKVKLSSLGSVTLGGKKASKYALKVLGTNIYLYYSSGGEWLRLETTLDDDKKLIYQRK